MSNKWASGHTPGCWVRSPRDSSFLGQELRDPLPTLARRGGKVRVAALH
jgi:hypothetical protein